MSVNTYINGQLHRVGGIAYYKAGQSIQVNVMPEASASLMNRVYQYIGATTENYTHGFFYECVLENGTYSWQILDTNPALDNISNSNLANMWASGGGSSVNVEPLTATDNGIYNAPSGTAYNPVTVDIKMDTLNAPKNGVYEIDTTTQNGWDTVLVDVYEKYNILFFSGATNYSPQTLNDDVSDEKYSELWITGYYLYNDNGYKNALWSGRYPTSILFPLISGNIIYGGGPHNHMWITPTNGKRFNTFFAEYDYPYMYIGIKNEDRTEDVLWQSTESSTPSTINLTQSIFDYDEVCFFFVKSDGATVTSWYYTDEIAVNDIIQGYIDTNVSKYTIASNTSLTTVSEDGFRLYGVYGIKDTSIDKTTLFTNSGSTNPSTINLSDDYTNYDELTLIGHYITDGTICTSLYPVKMFGMRDDLNAVDRICVGTTQNATWMSITTPLSFTLDPPSGSGYTVIIDKIVGTKRPVISTAHEFIDVIYSVPRVVTSDSAAVCIIMPLQENDEVHIDMELLRHNSEQSVLGKVYGPEVYLNGSQLILWQNGESTKVEWAAGADTSDISIGERRTVKVVVKEGSDYYYIMAYEQFRFPTYGKLYGVKVFRNGSMVHNLVPAQWRNNGIAIMYDTVTGIPYRSVSDTDFVAEES